MLFFAIVGSFFLAAILKFLATILSIEKRGYWQCYRAIFFSFCLLIPFLEYGLVSNQALLFFVKCFIFGVAILLGLSASVGKSSLAAIVLSLLFTISFSEKNQGNRNDQTFAPASITNSKEV
jgi:hypothetical protein